MKEFQNLMGHMNHLCDVSSSFIFNFITQSTLGFTCAVVFIYSLILRANHHSLFSAWVANLLGVFFHELSHAIIGYLLGAKPKKFIVAPQRITIQGKSYYNLGRVEFDNIRWFNALPTALAPLILLPIAYYIEDNFLMIVINYNSLIILVIYIYIQVTVIINSIPSIIDFMTIYQYKIGLFFWIIICLMMANIL